MNTQINIGGQIIDAPETLPDRRFRDAWVLDGDVISIDVDAAKPIARTRLAAMVEGVGNALTAGYSESEMRSWPTKYDAARAYLDDTAADWQASMIATEAQLRGVSAADLAALVITRGNAFALASAALAGIRGAGDAAITAATTVEQIEAALTAAQTALAQIGQ